MPRAMKIRTLVTKRQYYGMEAVALRAAMARVLSRVAGLPADEARVSRRHLCQDFGLDPAAAQDTLDQMVADGLLQQPDERQGDFALTERFFEFATARVVEPLPRERARQLLGKVCLLATQINAEWKSNPLEIVALAPFGSYISPDKLLAELPLGIVVRPRSLVAQGSLDADGEPARRREADPCRGARALDLFPHPHGQRHEVAAAAVRRRLSRRRRRRRRSVARPGRTG